MTEHRDWEASRNAILAKLDKGWAVPAIAAHYMVHFRTIRRLVDKWRPPEPIEDEPPQDAGGPRDGLSVGPEPMHIIMDEPSPISPMKALEDLARKHKRDNTERNAKILELSKGGLAPSAISRTTGLGRGVVIGVLHRAGMTAERGSPTDVQSKRLARNQVAQRSQASHEWAAGKHANAPIFGKGVKGGKGEGTGPVNVAKYRQEAPETAVLFDERKGCIWPFGDPREGPMRYCNEPTCRVRYGDSIQSVKYCADHWALRRATAHTKIIAPSA